MKRRVDAVEDLRQVLGDHLQKEDASAVVRVDESIGAAIRWRPHLLDEKAGVAWHILSEFVDSDAWIVRMQKAQLERPSLVLGVALPEELLHNHEEILLQLNELNSKVAILPAVETGPTRPVRISHSVADVIYENGFRLTSGTAEEMLKRLLKRCHEAQTNQAKGVALEVVTAVMLSQVSGFRVTQKGVSNRSQQMDVQVHSTNVGGVLGRSALIVAEAKNWNTAPGPTEYSWLLRKIETRYGMSRLGYFVTTDKFTRGVEIERLRDSKGEILIVPLDKNSLPQIWEGISEQDSITRRLETATIDAASQ
jgi:hypothetical protein